MQSMPSSGEHNAVQIAEKARKRRKRVSKDVKLSADQKRENHVSSEQRRRQAMRDSYDKLVEVVPGIEKAENRSELLIYTKTYHYLMWLYARNSTLRKELGEKAVAKGMHGFSEDKLPGHLHWSTPKK
ncbi:LAFE_0E02762g1_1 [Lachancea fermentati]|uniref:LAFE_0E02762g1_1 n=1 Tax=Lachancea fermentati TaxID=4955 RepID=A0A1G4MCG3_LACFM|nr:LAFE_0E02762g1_1 [Lachancea fermentati]